MQTTNPSCPSRRGNPRILPRRSPTIMIHEKHPPPLLSLSRPHLPPTRQLPSPLTTPSARWKIPVHLLPPRINPRIIPRLMIRVIGSSGRCLVLGPSFWEGGAWGRRGMGQREKGACRSLCACCGRCSKGGRGRRGRGTSLAGGAGCRNIGGNWGWRILAGRRVVVRLRGGSCRS